ncbi:hypothetical protein D3C81_1671200 [compost metagenome]
MNPVHGRLQVLEVAGLVHGIPLLEHAVVVEVGVAQAVGILLIPIQHAGPLHDGAKHRAVEHMGD